MKLDFLEELFVGELMGGVGELVHFGFGIDDIDVFPLDSSMKVSDSIVFSVSEPSAEGINGLGVCGFDIAHDVGLDIVGFLHDLLLDGLEELLWLHQEWPFHLDMLPDVPLGEIIQRQGSHCHPHDLVPVIRDPRYKFMVAIMQVIFAHVIIHQPSDIILGQRTIHITDQKLVIISVQVDFGLETHLLDLILNNVLPESQVKPHQVIGAQFHRMNIAVLVH